MATNSTTVKAAAGLAKAGQKAYARFGSFLAIFILVLFTSIGTAAKLDVLPDPQKAETTPVAVAAPLVTMLSPEEPSKIEIPTIGLSVSVSNPTSTNVEALDNALLKGAVRYPTSSKLGEDGNVIIFGHSSYLPIVHNQAFKAFDGIQKLHAGDRITVIGEGHRYVYAVDTVQKASATQDSIPLAVTGKKLTLATCDSFGEKTDRFVVTATLVETDAVPQ